MTYREIIYMCLDAAKQITDDIIINEDHTMFLIDKFRASLLWQKYKGQKLEVSESNYQTLCLDLEKTTPLDGDDCSSEQYLQSKDIVPYQMNIGSTVVYPQNFYKGINICIIPRERMRYVGDNKYLQNIIYCSIDPGGHLHLKSNNPQFLYLEKVRVTGIFENPREAAALNCEETCDTLDTVFPLEESLVSTLIDAVVKELVGAAWRPADDANNANDDLADLATFIARNSKSNLQKQMEA